MRSRSLLAASCENFVALEGHGSRLLSYIAAFRFAPLYISCFLVSEIPRADHIDTLVAWLANE